MGCRGSACVEVMTTLHGSAPSLQRRAEGCVPPEGTIASTRDPLKSTNFLFRATLTLQVEPQILLSRLSSLHVGSSESLRGYFSNNLNPILHLLVSSRECLDIDASLSISQTTPYCMISVSSCHSLSLPHFLLRGFRQISFLKLALFRFVVTFYLTFQDMLIDYAHFFTFFTCHGLNTSFFGRFAYFNFQPNIFIIER